MTLLAVIGSIYVFRDSLRQPWERYPGIDQAGGSDPMQAAWFLHWVPWASLHGLNPIVTDRMYVPDELNLAWNTLMPTLGILSAPVTLTLGPTLSYNVLMASAPVISSLTARYWFLRFVRSRSAAGIGGLVFGFGPFFAGHSQGHLNLTFYGLLPLVLAWTQDLLSGRSQRPTRTAVLLGLVTAAQVGVSEEMLLIIGLPTVAVGLAAAASNIQEARQALRGICRPFLLAVGIASVLSAPLLYAQLTGSHVSIPANLWRAAPSDFFVPTDRTLSSLFMKYRAATPVNTFEETAFVGYAMTAVVAFTVLVVNRWWVRVLALVAFSGSLLSLGVGQEANDQAMPYAWIQTVPYLNNVLPVRFSFVTMAAVSLLVAFAWDFLTQRPSWSRRAARVALLACLLTWAPLPVAAHDPVRPDYFRAGATDLPAGSVVLVLPLPRPFENEAQLWQSDASFRFRMYGGYALHNNSAGDTEYGPSETPLVATVVAVRDGQTPSPAGVDAVRSELRRDAAVAIIVIDDAERSNAYDELARRITGRAADVRDGGVRVWRLSGLE